MFKHIYIHMHLHTHVHESNMIKSLNMVNESLPQRVRLGLHTIHIPLYMYIYMYIHAQTHTYKYMYIHVSFICLYIYIDMHIYAFFVRVITVALKTSDASGHRTSGQAAD